MDQDKPSFSTLPCPYDEANVFSKYLTFYWITPLLRAGFKKGLSISDLFGNPKEDGSDILGTALQQAWYREVRNCKGSSRKPNLLRAFWSEYSFRPLLSWLWLVFSQCIASPLQAILLGQLIHDGTTYYSIRLNPGQEAENEMVAIYWKIVLSGILVILATFVISIAVHPYFFCVQHLGMKMRVASCNLVYQKSLRLSKAALGSTTAGQIVNLLSNDVNRFDYGLVFIPYLFVAPLQSVIIIVLLSKYYLGLAPTLAGFSVFLFYLPLQALMGKWFGVIREETAVRTDERIRLMNEIIPAMRVIKMYAWEKSFAKLVDLARREEVRWIRYRVILTSINESLYYVSAKVIILICLLTLVLLGYQLTAEAAFVTIAMLDTLRLNMTFFFPFAIASIAELVVSCDRLRNFLLLSELPKNKQPQAILDKESRCIICKELSAAWTDEETGKAVVTLRGVDFDLKLGELLVIVGRVGSGKSSILMALMGEMPILTGDLTIRGRVSYASQEPWIFSGTLQENILFGDELDEERMKEVIQVCALHRDIELLPDGKHTLVGERGISLSGGQKARINLARALYHQADIYLLDDPLSAVDASVAKHIFKQCIKGYLRDKAVVLVTHQLQFAKDSSKVLVVDSGNQIALGDFQELSKQADLVGFNKGQMYRSESEGESSSVQGSKSVSPSKRGSVKTHLDSPSTKHSGNQITQSSGIGTAESPDRKRKNKRGKSESDDLLGEAPMRQTTEEKLDEKTVDGEVYLYYLACVSSVLFLIVVFVSNFTAQAIFNGSDFYLSFWTDTEERRAIYEALNGVTPPQPPALPPNVIDTPSVNVTRINMEELRILNFTDRFTTKENSFIYGGIIIALFVAVLIRTTSFFSACMRASISMHDRLFKSVMAAPISFFDFNPIGIILNRISRDMGIVDDRLPQNGFDVVEIFTSTLGIAATVIVVDYTNLLPALGLVLTAIVARRVCLRTINRLKEMEGILRSQVFSIMSTTLSGLSTIRTFKVNQQFIDRFNVAQDEHSVAWFTFFSAGQWLGLALDMICLVFIIFVIIVLTVTIESSGLNGSQLGLAISSAIVIVGPFQWGIRQLVELESNMVSVKRIKEYSFLPREAAHESEPGKKPDKSWPDRGRIQFDDVSLRYFEDEQPVLKNLSFEIKPKEKVGIVGRTGAGKSSIVAALFRMTEPTGKIVIDGIVTHTIGLNDLRRAISIIPQEPILFSGNVRKNLDPFDEYTDQEIWLSLDAVRLGRIVLELEGGLDGNVTEGGSNFSIGQRQLICLARAILRKAKILVLDEATASVDIETDSIIQGTIRKVFADCTVITIAHRLHTVLDSDRIMVLDRGEVAEFDSPATLASNESSVFASLLKDASISAQRVLRIQRPAPLPSDEL